MSSDGRDQRFTEVGRRIRDGERPSEVLHDLFPTVRYIEDAPSVVLTDAHRCSITDELDRRCVLRAEHERECVVSLVFERVGFALPSTPTLRSHTAHDRSH